MKAAFLGFALLLALTWNVCAQTVTREQGANKSACTPVLTNGFVAKAESGKCYTIFGYNSGPDQWIMIFSTNAVPANASVPRHTPPIFVPTQHNFSVVWPGGKNMTNGITVVNSVTETSLTLGLKDCFYEVTFFESVF